MNLVNNNASSTKTLGIISGTCLGVRRIRMMCQGILIEVFDYNRTHEMLEVLTSVHNGDNDDLETTLDIAQMQYHPTRHTQLHFSPQLLAHLIKQLALNYVQ